MSRLKTMSVHSAAKFVGGWTAWCETSLKGWTETEEKHAHTNRWVKNQTHAPSTLRRRKRSFISAVRPTVHTNEAFPRRSSNREEFENVALFLRLGLPSTLIRHRNETFRLFKLEEFENEALFLRLGPQSTLIRHKSEAIPRRSLNRRNLKTPNFALIRGRITFWKRGYSKTMRASQQSRDFSDQVSLRHKSKMTGDCCVFKYLRRSVDGKYLRCFQSQTFIFKFFRHSQCWRCLNRNSWNFLRAGIDTNIRHAFSFVFIEAI